MVKHNQTICRLLALWPPLKSKSCDRLWNLRDVFMNQSSIYDGTFWTVSYQQSRIQSVLVEYQLNKGAILMKLYSDVLRDLVPFGQFKKREKSPWSSVTFRKVAGLKPATLLKVTLLHGCLIQNDTLYKWCKIAQGITYLNKWIFNPLTTSVPNYTETCQLICSGFFMMEKNGR